MSEVKFVTKSLCIKLSVKTATFNGWGFLLLQLSEGNVSGGWKGK